MKKILFSFLLIFCLISQGYAINIDTLKWLSIYVYDETWVLSDSQKSSLDAVIRDIRKKYTVEIFTVLLKTTDGEDIGQVGTNIGHSLGVGKKDVDNGIVVLVAVDDRAWNISTGYGVEWALPDLITKRIWERHFPPNFRNGDYYSWLLWALQDMEKYVAKDPWVISRYADEQTPWFEVDPTILIRYFIIATIISGFLFREDIRSGNMATFFKKFLITYLVTLPISYIVIGVYAFIINFFIWLFASLFSSGESKWWSGGSWGFGGGGFGGGGHSSWGFGGGGFGGGGSSGRW